MSRSLFFVEDLEQNLCPQFFGLECGATKVCVYKDGGQCTEREHAKQVLKSRFYFNYFIHYSGTDTQDSQKFIPSRRFNIIQIWNYCMCKTVPFPLPSDHPPK